MKNFSRSLVIVLSVASMAVLVGCSSGGPVEGTAASTPATATPTPTPTPDAAPGTRANPFKNGTPGKYSDDSMWTVTWKETNGDAWPVVQAENEFNDAPPEGKSFVLGTFTVAASGDDAEPVSAPASLGITYVGTDGNSYDTSSACGVFPGTDFRNLGDMYGGASSEASVCTTVPSGAVKGGSWRVESYTTADLYSFFTGA